ncbi:MAG: ABC transporter permease [Candidatus Firestonebacteria bacterium]
MSKVWAIAKREFKNYFVSPVAYILIVMFVLIVGLFFNFLYVTRFSYAQLDSIVYNMTNIFMFFSPMLTMKLFSEEKKLGTIELLYTSPVTVTEVVLGKYLGSILFFGVVFGIMLQFPAFVLIYGKPDFWPMVSCLLGFVLAACTYLAIGMFASSLTESQMGSAMIGFALVIFFWIVSIISDNIAGPAGNWLGNLSMSKHFIDFLKGIVDAGNVFFFVALSSLFVFLTIRRLEWKRW